MTAKRTGTSVGKKKNGADAATNNNASDELFGEPHRLLKQFAHTVQRPIDGFAGLPPQLIWELIRRHGVYQSCWSLARSNGPASSPAVRVTARTLLKLIGCTWATIDPATPADEVGFDQWPVEFRQGGIIPLTLRQIFRVLVNELTPEQLSDIGAGLISFGTEQQSSEQLSLDLHELAESECLDFLDRTAPGTMICVQPQAPLRTVRSAIARYHGSLRQHHGIPARRPRPDLIRKRLKVWDLREGWIGSGYDGLKELTLPEIARQLKQPLATIRSQYHSAYKDIAGHDYDLRSWLVIFGIWKINRVAAGESAPRRSLIRAMPALTSNSNLEAFQPGIVSKSPMDGLGLDDDALALAAAIIELIQTGHSDASITEKLDLSAEGRELVPYFRHRLADGL